jgi:hypothetical protein
VIFSWYKIDVIYYFSDTSSDEINNEIICRATGMPVPRVEWMDEKWVNVLDIFKKI